MTKFAQGLFNVKNIEKFVGNKPPRYRSSWEWHFMTFCDNDPSVIKWASEPIRLPYRNPVTGKQTTYVPDFIVTYRTKNNEIKAELIEIKPRSQSVVEGRMSEGKRMVVGINHAKWQVASAWARQNGMTFRVVTEEDIFHVGSIPKTSRKK